MFAAGVLRVWDATSARCVYTQTLPSTFASVSEEDEEKDDNPRSVTYLFHLPISSRVATVTAEHNILLYQLPELTTQQQVRIKTTTFLWIQCFGLLVDLVVFYEQSKCAAKVMN